MDAACGEALRLPRDWAKWVLDVSGRAARTVSLLTDETAVAPGQ